MSLQLAEATLEDMHEMQTVVFAAYSDTPFARLVVPEIGTETVGIIEKGIQSATEKSIRLWKASSTEYWIKIVDSETGTIIGVSRWQIYKDSPFTNGAPHVEAEWYPVGSRIREYCTYLMNHRLKRQANRCNLPNIWLNMICTQPNYRRRGVAALMMQWGVTQADELELEMFVEASSDGTHLYRNFGFIEVEELSTPRPEGELDEEWKKLEEDYPFEATWMWRPKQGIQSKDCLE